MLDRLRYSASFPFKRKRGERYGVQEAKNFLQKIKSGEELGLKDFAADRDKLLFDILDDMIWYRNLPDHWEKTASPLPTCC